MYIFITHFFTEYVLSLIHI
ncbi:stress response small protein YobI [Escherichia coli]